MYKYVIVEEDGTEYPYIFPKIVNHSDVGRNMLWLHKNGRVVSAGFLSVRSSTNALGFKFIAHGRSETLKIDSRPKDGDFITLSSYTGGRSDLGEFFTKILKEDGNSANVLLNIQRLIETKQYAQALKLMKDVTEGLNDGDQENVYQSSGSDC